MIVDALTDLEINQLQSLCERNADRDSVRVEAGLIRRLLDERKAMKDDAETMVGNIKDKLDEIDGDVNEVRNILEG